MHFSVKEDIIQLTEKWDGERFPDGRPRVSDEDLEEIRHLTLEEVWQPMFIKGYLNQFEEKLKRLHEDKTKLVGRAVTCSFMPARPDLVETVKKIGDSEGRKGTCNQWVIDTLVEGDVVVADMYDKIYEGTFVGGNLSTAIKNRTKTGGAVVWGGIRDLEQIEGIEGLQVYYRGVDPTPIKDFVMTSFNSMTKIGGAVCLPGDVVFGYGGGVIFIPSHMVKEVIEFARKMHVKDIFGFEMIKLGVYTTADIDIDVWPTEMMNRLVAFIKEDERGEQYRNLDWSKEFAAAEEK
ncbi:RraA family protein [Ruminococcus sp. 1001136sp1]|uniref:RraA family protein n=1 Tax=unclassified Ruminococcus TaxID=2608920 RepID=UPI00189EC2DE|nr:MULTISPECIES: RraA family protein [unclassified Ruminococcus]MDB8773864.1 RraA family protein [Ruminococcus sp. 1001136sp1]MDB8785231.1 RraA family protein [Ruminococcus sp. 1001136sp1]